MQAKIARYVNTTKTIEPEDSFQETEIGLIPKDWEVVRLGDLFDLQQGKAMSPKARLGISPQPFLRTVNVLWGHIDLSTLDYMDFTEEEITRLRLQPDDLLVCEGGEIGRTAMWRGEIGVCGYQNHIHRLRKLRKDIEPEFYMYWMQAAFLILGLYLGEAIRTTIPNLSGGRLKSFLVPKPPLPEQQKIAKVLGTIQRAIKQQDKIIETAKNLKKSLMQKLFTKGLSTENTKESEIGEIPAHWHVEKCQEVCEKITVGIVVKPASLYVQNGVPCFRSLNIREDRLNENDLVFISPAANEMHSKSKLREGDVLVVRTGYPGTSCVVPRKYDGANCIDLVILRPGKNIISEFLSRFFHSPAGRRQTLRNKGGLAQKHLNVGAVKSTLVPIPPLLEQKEIIRILSRVDSKIDVEKSRKKTLEELFKTMLHELMTAEIRLKDIEV